MVAMVTVTFIQAQHFSSEEDINSEYESEIFQSNSEVVTPGGGNPETITDDDPASGAPIDDYIPFLLLSGLLACIIYRKNIQKIS